LQVAENLFLILGRELMTIIRQRLRAPGYTSGEKEAVHNEHLLHKSLFPSHDIEKDPDD
jgi:hypothetical protein